MGLYKSIKEKQLKLCSKLLSFGLEALILFKVIKCTINEFSNILLFTFYEETFLVDWFVLIIDKINKLRVIDKDFYLTMLLN